MTEQPATELGELADTLEIRFENEVGNCSRRIEITHGEITRVLAALRSRPLPEVGADRWALLKMAEEIEAVGLREFVERRKHLPKLKGGRIVEALRKAATIPDCYCDQMGERRQCVDAGKCLMSPPPGQSPLMRESVLEFDAFLNEPPSYEDQRMVRDYRHQVYKRWAKIRDAILREW